MEEVIIYLFILPTTSACEFYVILLIIHPFFLLLIARDVVFSVVFVQRLIRLWMKQEKTLLTLAWFHRAIVQRF